MGEAGDLGPRDDAGREHGPWIYLRPIKYALTDGSFFETHTRMTVDYEHGQVIKAYLEYDISKQHTTSWEEGRAIGSPLEIEGRPFRFKKGLWRGTDNKGFATVTMYDGVTALWRYHYEGFKYAVRKDDCFYRWVEESRVRPPPPKNEWPLEWNPYLDPSAPIEDQWIPPCKIPQVIP
jgi:hypothetical protein